VNKLFFFILLLTSCVWGVDAQPKTVQPKKTVTFKVDMSGELKNVEEPGSIGIRGSVPPLSWNKTYPMTDKNNDGIYEATITFQSRKNIPALEYKFFHDTAGWESIANRVVTLRMPVTKLPLQKWNSGPAGVKGSSVSPEELFTIISTLDSSLFSTFYSCNPIKNAAFFTDDLEFYHDKGGVTKTKKVFMENLSKYYCGDPKYTTRRALVPGSLKVYPIPNYGAVEEGTHWFYETEKGKTEKLVGVAKFMIVWKQTGTKWQVSRAISYDHQLVK
jgi:hypothetical protein